MRNLAGAIISAIAVLALAALPVWGAAGQSSVEPQYAPPRGAAALANTNRAPAVVGTVNYVEGAVTLNGAPITQNQVGSMVVEQGETIVTDQGRAEVLLTPGVVVRLDDGTAVQMISSSLTKTEVGLENGRAAIEVGYITPANDISVAENGATIRVTKRGLYEFDAAHASVRVFQKGEAVVQDGNHNVTVKSDHQLALSGNLKTSKFDEAAAQDDFYNFNSLRSSYLAEANEDIGPSYVAPGGWYGPAWVGAGWYWDPWFDAYTWLPADGLFFDPFGWGFYAPFYFGFYNGFGYAPRYPLYGGGFGGHVYRHFDSNYRPAIANEFHGSGAVNSFHAGVTHGPANSFHGMGMYGGGFAHSGGGGFGGFGGFHGGGFGGGGFHGGGGFGGGGHGR